MRLDSFKTALGQACLEMACLPELAGQKNPSVDGLLK
jgi:hypothetical protein